LLATISRDEGSQTRNGYAFPGHVSAGNGAGYSQSREGECDHGPPPPTRGAPPNVQDHCGSRCDHVGPWQAGGPAFSSYQPTHTGLPLSRHAPSRDTCFTSSAAAPEIPFGSRLVRVRRIILTAASSCRPGAVLAFSPAFQAPQISLGEGGSTALTSDCAP
jgi:hypothetical protein